jgi:hypothetical protein
MVLRVGEDLRVSLFSRIDMKADDSGGPSTKGGFVRDLREKARVGFGWDARVHGRIPPPIAASIDAARYGGDRGFACPFARLPLQFTPESVGDALIIRAAAGGQVTSIVRDNAPVRGEVKTCRTD